MLTAQRLRQAQQQLATACEELEAANARRADLTRERAETCERAEAQQVSAQPVPDSRTH